MAAADYSWCPVCDRKAAYDGEDMLEGFTVTHDECWEALAGELGPALQAAIEKIRAAA